MMLYANVLCVVYDCQLFSSLFSVVMNCEYREAKKGKVLRVQVTSIDLQLLEIDCENMNGTFAASLSPR